MASQAAAATVRVSSVSANELLCVKPLQELLTALDVQQTTISAAHLRMGQQLKQLQVWHCHGSRLSVCT